MFICMSLSSQFNNNLYHILPTSRHFAGTKLVNFLESRSKFNQDMRQSSKNAELLGVQAFTNTLRYLGNCAKYGVILCRLLIESRILAIAFDWLSPQIASIGLLCGPVHVLTQNGVRMFADCKSDSTVCNYLDRGVLFGASSHSAHTVRYSMQRTFMVTRAGSSCQMSRDTEYLGLVNWQAGGRRDRRRI